MKFTAPLLAASCALALAACGADDRPADADPPSDASILPAEDTPADAPSRPPGPGTPAPVQGVPAQTDSGMRDGDPTRDTMPPARASDASADPGSPTADETRNAATVTDCSTTVEGDDRMQFNVDSIHVPGDCSEFTINLEHTGSLPVAAMGHNVVVTTTADYPAAAADGLTAGPEAGYVQPDDERVIAATEMIGGGESTSVTFSTSGLDSATGYTFFCSFPGHSALMRGTLSFGS